MPSPLVTRRSVAVGLGSLAALGLGANDEARADDTAASPDFEVKDLSVGNGKAKRFTLLLPKHLAKGATVPLVVALHGLGEAHDEALGVRAWLDLYGLRTAYSRILRPPITRTGKLAYLSGARLAELGDALAKKPFGGLAIACPYTPNPKDAKDRTRFLDAYAAWIVDEVVARARKETQVDASVRATTLVGCSMGGSVALEVFARRPEAFGGLGVVQGALSDQTAEKHATMVKSAIDRLGTRDVEILSSEGDPFVSGARAFAKALEKRNVPVELRVPPGPHDQPWLREAGTLEMLFYQSRRA